MKPSRLSVLFAAAALAAAASARAQQSDPTYKFSFGPGTPVPGYTQVNTNTMYGYGFEPTTAVPAPGIAVIPTSMPALKGLERTSENPLHSSAITSDKTFLFSVAVPEGNYKVTLTLGDPQAETTTTVKAEARRLVLERIHTAKGQFVTKSFTVNVRQPQIPGGGGVQLDPREPGSYTWDDKLSLQFSDSHPALSALEIQKTQAITVFLCGDSTVTDQPREPYGTWGQMLPRWFKPEVAIANYAESGETLKAFRFERRWDKVMSQVKPGDYVFMQFGHNDLNKTGRNAMWPADQPSGDWSKTYSEANTDYKQLLKDYAAEVKKKGAIPVIVSPMTKISIQTGELNIAGMRDYPQAAVAAAKEADIALIDLNAMSIDVAKGLGTDLAKRAYVDGLHTNTYGGYLLARCVVEGIKQAKLGIAQYIVDDAETFDPAHPAPLPADFKLPLEPGGNFGGRGRGRGPATATAPAR